MAATSKLKQLKKQYEDRWTYPPALKPKKLKYIACGKNAPNKEKDSYTPCWKSPGMTADVRFGPCWDYQPQRFKKYPLPRTCRGAPIIEPKFDDCKSFYTRYDFRLEECVHQQILIVEGVLRQLETLLADTKEQQIQWVKRMRCQAMRRRLLIGSACGIKIYPEYLSQMAEQRALCAFQKAYNEVNASNSQLTAQILVLRTAMGELRNRLDKLDRTLESPFLMSLDTVLRTIQDLYDFYFETARKYKTWAQLIDAGQEHSVDDYLALLLGNLDFESFKRAGTEQCTCKRCRHRNPLEPYLPCWCQGRDRRETNIQLISDEQQPDTQSLSSDSLLEPAQKSDTSILQLPLEI